MFSVKHSRHNLILIYHLFKTLPLNSNYRQQFLSTVSYIDCIPPRPPRPPRPQLLNTLHTLLQCIQRQRATNKDRASDEALRQIIQHFIVTSLVKSEVCQINILSLELYDGRREDPLPTNLTRGNYPSYITEDTIISF